MKLQQTTQSIIVNKLNLFGVYEEIQLGHGCSNEAVIMFKNMLNNPSISLKARQYAEEMLALHEGRLSDLKM